MSAYVVERNHIRFLVAAAERMPRNSSKFSYYHPERKKSGRLYMGEDFTPDQLGQLLWDENIRSVTDRYPDCQESDGTVKYENLPGPVDEVYLYQHPKELGWHNMDPVAVLKACDCYEYQACEHKDWEESEAHTALWSIREYAICKLPGYDKAAWGAPNPNSGAVSILSLVK